MILLSVAPTIFLANINYPETFPRRHFLDGGRGNGAAGHQGLRGRLPATGRRARGGRGRRRGARQPRRWGVGPRIVGQPDGCGRAKTAGGGGGGRARCGPERRRRVERGRWGRRERRRRRVVGPRGARGAHMRARVVAPRSPSARRRRHRPARPGHARPSPRGDARVDTQDRRGPPVVHPRVYRRLPRPVHLHGARRGGRGGGVGARASQETRRGMRPRMVRRRRRLAPARRATRAALERRRLGGHERGQGNGAPRRSTRRGWQGRGRRGRPRDERIKVGAGPDLPERRR